MLRKVTLKDKKLKEHERFLTEREKGDLIEKFSKLKGKRVVHINSTSKGGGVAQILSSLTPLLNSYELSADWFTFKAPEEFFKTTKKIHNLLQGEGEPVTEKEKKLYLSVSKKLAEKVKRLNFDLLIIHDPQPAGVLNFYKAHPSILRLHLDTTGFKKSTAPFLYEIFEKSDHMVFSGDYLAFKEVSDSDVSIVPPAIDPLSETNKPIKNSKKIIESLGADMKKPLISQVSRFDKFKNPSGVVDIYKRTKREIPELQLMLFGIGGAEDDPEAEEVFKNVKEKAGGDSDIRLFFHPESIEHINAGEKQIVNSIQRESDIILQNSYKEAFGLTVTEAMWKRTPVIGGPGLGIKRQIRNGENGYVITTPEEGVKRVIELIKDPKKRRRLGKKGRESVRKNYLITELLEEHLELYRFLLANK